MCHFLYPVSIKKLLRKLYFPERKKRRRKRKKFVLQLKDWTRSKQKLILKKFSPNFSHKINLLKNMFAHLIHSSNIDSKYLLGNLLFAQSTHQISSRWLIHFSRGASCGVGGLKRMNNFYFFGYLCSAEMRRCFFFWLLNHWWSELTRTFVRMYFALLLIASHHQQDSLLRCNQKQQSIWSPINRS